MLEGRGILMFALAILPSPLWAAGKGQGALVNRDGAPVYQTADASDPVVVLNRGKAVSAISGNIVLKPDYRFDERDTGRVRVNYFSTADDRGKFQIGFMDPHDLSKFTYDCSCSKHADDCSPFDTRGLKFSFSWNVCFQEARDAKLEQLEASAPSPSAAPAPGAARTQARSATAAPGGAAVSTYQTPPTANGTACGKNFSAHGSMIRGSKFTTFVDLPGLEQGAVIQRLLDQLSANELTLVSANKEAGAVSTFTKASNGKPLTVDFAVTPQAGAVRAQVTMKMGIGMGADDDVIRDELCKILGGLQSPAPPPVQASAPQSKPVPGAQPAQPAGGASPIEDRLRKLDELHKKGLITDAEYQKKRAELLSQL
jgi:hypothetical protein